MPYATLFEPVVKPRENIRLVPALRGRKQFFQVEYVEPVYGIIIDLGQLAASSSTSLSAIDNLDLDENQLGQWRLFLLDDFELLIKQPRAVERGTTKVVSTKITPYTMILDPELKSTEFYTFEDKTRVYIQATNPTNSSVYARIFVYGWKFLLKEIEQPAKYTDIPIAVFTRERG